MPSTMSYYYRYKEGRVILEKALIKEMEGFEENLENTTSH